MMSSLPTFNALSEQAAKLSINGQAFIGGAYVNAASGETYDCNSPIDGRHLTSVASCDEEDADRAVKSARECFESGVWSGMSAAERKKILLALADLIDANADELALLECLDVGKPIRFARMGDIPGAAQEFRWYAELIDKVYGEVAPTSGDALGLIVREPIGVVAAVIPWNFPLFMASWKVAPALAAGNCVVLKPAEQSPLTAIRLAALAVEAGMPPGVLNVAPGFGEKVGQALGRHPDVDLVTFTGSTAVGKMFLTYAGESNLKQVSLECGGKTPNIIFADALDLDKAAMAAAQSIFYNAGQVCAAASRLLVDERIADEFNDKVITAAQTAFKPGNPLDPATIYGAIVDETQLARIEDYVAAGQAAGAHLAAGGTRAEVTAGGFYMQPTVFQNVRNDMKIAQEEIFGPVLSVIPFTDVENAIRIANDSIYGLQACLWTSDLATAHKTARRLRAGAVAINSINASSVLLPFGGYKQSGFGRDRSHHAFEKYTQMKAIYADLS